MIETIFSYSLNQNHHDQVIPIRTFSKEYSNLNYLALSNPSK